MAWLKLSAVDPHGSGCLQCPNPTRIAAMDMVIAVGFGSACLIKDGQVIYDGESEVHHKGKDFDELMKVADAELMAAADPDHDWRIELHGPLHGETYQRHDVAQWVCIEANQGFA